MILILTLLWTAFVIGRNLHYNVFIANWNTERKDLSLFERTTLALICIYWIFKLVLKLGELSNGME